MAEALVPRQVALRSTGQVVSLDLPSDDLAQFLWDVRGFEQELRTAKRQVGDELLRRQDADASWTTYTNSFEISGSSPAPKVEWDGEMLNRILGELLKEKLISADAVLAAIERVITYKPKPKGLNALMKLGEGIKERLLAARSEVEKTRYVRVERVP
jgi:hypothetical protein